MADYLLGYYENASTFQPGPFSTSGSQPGNLNQYVFRYFAPYFQDDWKVNDRLTLNLGLRWDYRNVPLSRATSFSGSTTRTLLAACALPTKLC